MARDGFFKWADALGSGTADPSTAPARQASVPPSAIENKPAPGQKGPMGMSGRTTYSRANTGLAPIPDAGSTPQKNLAPRGMEFLPKLASTENRIMTTSTKARPDLQDLIKTAMEGAGNNVDISLEAARQITNAGGTAPRTVEKTASAKTEHVSTELIHKLAAAAQYTATQLDSKLASTNFPTENSSGPGNGPNASEVMAAKSEEENIDAGQGGQATSANQQPMNPATQKDPTRKTDPGNGLATNDAMSHDEQPVEPISNEKTTLTNDNVKAAAVQNNLLALGLLKVAHDEQGNAHLVPTSEIAKEALLAEAGGVLGGGAKGAVGGGLSGTAKGVGYGGLGGAALGGAGGALAGGMAGGIPGAIAGGLGGAALGGTAGAALGGVTGGAAGTAMGAGKGAVEGYQGAKINKALEANPELRKQLISGQGMSPKQASAYARNLMSLGLYKEAEDALNPAKVSGGKADATGATPPKGAAPSEEGVPSEPSDVSKQKALISSNMAAINFKKRDAKSDPKSDVGDVLKEPAQTKSTDKVLDKVLDHTDEAGAKISSADLTRVAAARAVVQKLASVAQEKGGKKTKKAMGMGGDGSLASAEGQAGFSAAGM